MPVSVRLNITQNSYNSASNTSTVTVSVIAVYDDYTWNNTGTATGQLSINGNTYNFIGRFNASQKESGSEIMYSQTVAIDHSVTNVVNCSVTYNSGTIAGTVSASASKQLSGDSSGGDPGGGDSGGDGGGGSGGDDGGGDSGGDSGGDDGDIDLPEVDEDFYYLEYNIDERCHVLMSVVGTTSVGNTVDRAADTLTGVGAWWYSSAYTTPLLYPKVDMQEDLKNHYCLIEVIDHDDNVVIPNRPLTGGGEEHFVIKPGWNYVTIRVLPKELKEYNAYIDAEVTYFPHYTSECSFDGHATIEVKSNAQVEPPSYSISESKDIGCESIRRLYFLKFTTPEFAGDVENIIFVMQTNSSIINASSRYLDYWISSSDSNYVMYADYIKNEPNKTTPDVVYDENLITCGRCGVESNVLQFEVNVSNVRLECNTTYYLILHYDHLTQDGSLQRKIHAYPSITINSIGALRTDFIQHEYECYIDNGDGWEKRALYIEDEGAEYGGMAYCTPNGRFNEDVSDWDISEEPSYNIHDAYMQMGYRRITGEEKVVYIEKFVTPEFTGYSHQINVKIPMSKANNNEFTCYYWLLEDDYYYETYCMDIARADADDDFDMSGYNNLYTHKVGTFVVPEGSISIEGNIYIMTLEPNTEYYLMLYHNDSSAGSIQLKSGTYVVNHTPIVRFQ